MGSPYYYGKSLRPGFKWITGHAAWGYISAPAHLFVTRYTEGLSHLVTPMTAPVASGWSLAGWGLHPLENAALPRRTPNSDIRAR